MKRMVGVVEKAPVEIVSFHSIQLEPGEVGIVVAVCLTPQGTLFESDLEHLSEVVYVEAPVALRGHLHNNNSWGNCDL